MASTRKCKNWLDTFMEWTLPASEAPESMLTWSGLFCLAAVLKRRVRYSKELVKKWDVYPTSYIMFVADPGVAKKSTTAGYAEELLSAHNASVMVTDPSFVNFGPTSGSDVKLIERMSETTDGSMTVIAGEFGNIVKSRAVETYDFFTKMFDNSKNYVHDTMATSKMTVLEPSFNLLGCTTPDWMAKNTGYITGGGFAARTIFVFEYKARQRKLHDKVYWEENGEVKSKDLGHSVLNLDIMQKNLLHDLKVIGALKGEAKPIDLRLEKRINDWYVDYVDRPTERGTETFQQRKHVHTLRTAILLSLCERDDLLITNDHFDKALSLIEYVEKRLARGFSVVGSNPFGAQLEKVLEYIESHTPVKKGAVLSYFYKDIPLPEISNILEVLKTADKIEEVSAIGSTPQLRIKKK